MARAFVGLGANLGDAASVVEQAIALIAGLPSTHLVARSSLYVSAPVDATGPDFINAVVGLETDLQARELLAALQAIEAAHGRQRPFRNAPRTLDLDVLLYANVIDPDPLLTLPHPRMTERAFVLQPLLEIAPDLTLPDGRLLATLARAVHDQAISRLAPEPRP